MSHFHQYFINIVLYIWQELLKLLSCKKSNKFSQKATFKTICHTFINISSILSWSKVKWICLKGQLFKQYVTLFTRINEKDHWQLLNELSQKTMFKTMSHTLDRQPDRTTSAKHNKYYDVTNPIMRGGKYFENTQSISYRHRCFGIATSVPMCLVSPGIWWSIMQNHIWD